MSDTKPDRQPPQLAVVVRTMASQPIFQDRLKEVLGARTPQFVASLSGVARGLPVNTDPTSIITSAIVAATLDLPIQKDLGFAWIVPYWNKDKFDAQFQLGYKGYVQLAQRTGQYKTINVTEVYDGEIEKFNRLTGEFAIEESKRKTPEKVVGYAAYFQLVSGFEKAVYWPLDQVRKHAERFSQAFKKKQANSPWTTDFDAMAKKTVLKFILSHWGILSVELRNAIKADQGIIKDIELGEDDVTYPDNPREDTTDAKSPTGLPKKQDGKQAQTSFFGAGTGDKPPQQETPPAEDKPVTALRKKLVEASLTEADMMGYLLKMKVVDETMRHLDDVAHVDENAIVGVLENWDSIKDKVKPLPKK